MLQSRHPPSFEERLMTMAFPPRRRWAALALAPALGLAVAWPRHTACEPAPPRLEGRYVTASGNLEVELAPCAAVWCGTVTKVIANRSMTRSGENMQPADPRPPLGMRILTEVHARGDAADGTWHGTLYNRENAKSYPCNLRLDEHGDLVLRIYVGLPLFGQTQVWHRVILAPAALAQEPHGQAH